MFLNGGGATNPETFLDPDDSDYQEPIYGRGFNGDITGADRTRLTNSKFKGIPEKVSGGTIELLPAPPAYQPKSTVHGGAAEAILAKLQPPFPPKPRPRPDSISIEPGEILSDGYSQKLPIGDIMSSGAGDTPQPVSQEAAPQPDATASVPDISGGKALPVGDALSLGFNRGLVGAIGKRIGSKYDQSPFLQSIWKNLSSGGSGDRDVTVDLKADNFPPELAPTEKLATNAGLLDNTNAPDIEYLPDVAAPPFMPDPPVLPPNAPDNSQAFNTALELEKSLGPDGLLDLYKKIMNDSDQQELAQSIEQLLHRNAALENSFVAPTDNATIVSDDINNTDALGNLLFDLLKSYGMYEDGSIPQEQFDAFRQDLTTDPSSFGVGPELAKRLIDHSENYY